MPLAVFVLGLSVFALGTSEFMISGLLPDIAHDLSVSIPDAGLLISAFAIGMVIGAPLLAASTLRLPRRATLLSLLAVFALGQVAGGLAGNYQVLLVSRVVSALACAGFWAVAAVTAIGLVPQHRRGRAMAIMIGGLSLANVLGVPAGTFLGQHAGWRAAFWAVAVASAVSWLGVLALVPGAHPDAPRPRLRGELRVYRNPRIWLAIATTALLQAAVFGTFSYLAPWLTEVSGLPRPWVPGVLALFGIGALLGSTLGGRLADAQPTRTLYAGIPAVAALILALSVTGGHTTLAVILVFLLGFTGFTMAPTLNTRVFALAGDAPTLAGATNTAAFNVGNTAGPWLGGLVIGANLGYPSIAWVSLVLSAAALGTVALAGMHRPARAPAPVACEV